jgi:hypothetical protein
MMWNGVNNPTLIQDQRTISACIRATFIGPVLESKGQIGTIENLPLSALIGKHVAGIVTEPPSPNELFDLATWVQRCGIDTMEVVWRPSAENPATFVSERDIGLYTQSYLGFPAPIPTQLGDYANSREPTCFGFVWKNVLSNQLSFETVKNIEWRPRANQGFMAQIPRAINDHDYSGSVLKFLDRLDPTWTRRILDASASASSTLLTAVFTGYFQAAGRGRKGLLK